MKIVNINFSDSYTRASINVRSSNGHLDWYPATWSNRQGWVTPSMNKFQSKQALKAIKKALRDEEKRLMASIKNLSIITKKK